jgi:hypothetical protein
MQSVPITTNVASSNPTQERCTRYNIMWLSLSVTCDRLVVSPGTTVSSTNKTDRHYITEILLKVALNTITHNKLEVPVSKYLLVTIITGSYAEFVDSWFFRRASTTDHSSTSSTMMASIKLWNRKKLFF